MRRYYFLGFLIIVSLTARIFAQSPTPSAGPVPQKSPPPQEEVVRITTNLVQVDLSVVDQNNKTVTDLKPEEFEEADEAFVGLLGSLLEIEDWIGNS